jgi:hypothetical protein
MKLDQLDDDFLSRLKVFETKNGLRALSRMTGIYFLVHQEEIEYIGRSVNIGNRLTSHHVFDRKHHDHILVYETGFNPHTIFNLKNIERNFIKLINPARNINATERQTIMQTGKKIKHG